MAARYFTTILLLITPPALCTDIKYIPGATSRLKDVVPFAFVSFTILPAASVMIVAASMPCGRERVKSPSEGLGGELYG